MLDRAAERQVAETPRRRGCGTKTPTVLQKVIGPLGRQSAEGRAGEVARAEAARPDAGRADARHRRGREGRDLPADGALADSGIAILMVSSEMEEVIGMSDRVVVMREAADHRCRPARTAHAGTRGGADDRPGRWRRHRMRRELGMFVALLRMCAGLWLSEPGLPGALERDQHDAPDLDARASSRIGIGFVIITGGHRSVDRIRDRSDRGADRQTLGAGGRAVLDIPSGSGSPSRSARRC